MTDRHAGYIVTLAKDLREDDAQAVLNALYCIRGVVAVQPIVTDVAMVVAQARAREEVREKLLRLLNELHES